MSARVWLMGPAPDVLLLSGLGLVPLLALLPLPPPAWLFPLATLFVFDPHIASTYMRLYIDADERRRSRLLAFVAPPVVVAATWAAIALVPPGILGFLLYHVQLWHTLRQSEGILRIYQRRRGSRIWLDRAALWAIPLFGTLVQWQVGSGDYLGFPRPSIVLPLPALIVAGAIAGGLTLAFLVAAVRNAGGPRTPELALILGNAFFFAAATLVVRDLGWENLVLSLYHGVQYVAIVGFYTQRRTSGRLLAWAAPHVWRYLALLVALGVLYALVFRHALPLLAAAPALLVVQWSVRIHHYVVDARIWRLRARPDVAEGVVG